MKHKKLITLALAAAMTASASGVFADQLVTSRTAPVLTNPFADAIGKWYEDSVAYCYSMGLLKGFEDSLFHPDSDISGAQFATILHRIYLQTVNSEESEAAENDVWYAAAAAWARANKIIDGFGSDDFFSAGAPLKREDVMTMLYNLYQLNHADEDVSEIALNELTDSDMLSEYAVTAAKWCLKNAIITGDDNSKMNPQNSVTRAEVSAILERYFKNCLLTGENGEKTEYASLEDAEMAAGYSLPDISLEGLKAEKFFVLNSADSANSILEVTGTYETKDITIRMGKGDRPISGIQVWTALESGLEDLSVTYGRTETDTVFAEWSKTVDQDIYCYSVVIQDGTVADLNWFVEYFGAEPLKK